MTAYATTKNLYYLYSEIIQRASIKPLQQIHTYITLKSLSVIIVNVKGKKRKSLRERNARHEMTLDTIGNCQRPVFSLRVSQDIHKIKNPVQI